MSILRHHLHTAALGVLLVALGAAGAASAACARDVSWAFYALVAVLGALLCLRASEVAWLHGRESVLTEMLQAMREQRDHHHHDTEQRAPSSVVEPRAQDPIAQGDDLR